MNNTVQARIQLRYDSYINWMSSEVILLPGEIAVAVFNYQRTISSTDITPENTPPAIGLKVGDGVHYFDELPWIQAVAADVYDWAKASSKPIYSATEITGLADFIAQHGGGGGSSGGAASSGYKIRYDASTNKYILQYYDEATGEWIDTTSEINLNDIITRINTIERWANGARVNLGRIELPIAEYIYEEVITYINALDYNDEAVAHEFVTEVTEVNGKINVTRSILSANDITSGVLPTERGGTGFSFIEDDELLVGSASGELIKRKFVTDMDGALNNTFATTGAIKNYVLEQTAGLTGAMHFIGEATVVITNSSAVNPQINGYNFSQAQEGDVILANGGQEYVWTGVEWRLLGDEGSYAIKGSITNVDIADEAAINKNKIDGLNEALDGKVDKVEGKSLSSNDYTNLEKDKLTDIENGAQVNIIEHIFVNDTEAIPQTVNGADKSVNLQIPVLTQENADKLDTIEVNAQENVIEHILLNGTEINPTTINNVPKSVNIQLVSYTQEEKDKLLGIETEAQVNKIETITINGTQYTPGNNKNIEITLDQAVLDLNVLEGARYPNGNNTYTEIDITNKKLELSHIAATGDVAHLLQTQDTYITINCGSSTTVL